MSFTKVEEKSRLEVLTLPTSLQWLVFPEGSQLSLLEANFDVSRCLFSFSLIFGKVFLPLISSARLKSLASPGRLLVGWHPQASRSRNAWLFMRKTKEEPDSDAVLRSFVLASEVDQKCPYMFLLCRHWALLKFRARGTFWHLHYSSNESKRADEKVLGVKDFGRKWRQIYGVNFEKEVERFWKTDE